MKWDGGGSFDQAVKCRFTVCLWLLTNSCSVRNSLPPTNTASPSFCWSLTPSFLEISCQEIFQIRRFKTPLTVSFLCSQHPQCNPSCTRTDSEVQCEQNGFFCLLFLEQFGFQDVTVCCGKAPSHCLETQLLGSICSKTKQQKHKSSSDLLRWEGLQLNIMCCFTVQGVLPSPKKFVCSEATNSCSAFVIRKIHYTNHYDRYHSMWHEQTTTKISWYRQCTSDKCMYMWKMNIQSCSWLSMAGFLFSHKSDQNANS